MNEELYKMLQARHVDYKNKVNGLYSEAIKLLDSIEQRLKGLFESSLSTANIISNLALVEEIIEAMKSSNTWFEFADKDMKKVTSLEEFKEKLGVNYKG